MNKDKYEGINPFTESQMDVEKDLENLMKAAKKCADALKGLLDDIKNEQDNN